MVNKMIDQFKERSGNNILVDGQLAALQVTSQVGHFQTW